MTNIPNPNLLHGYMQMQSRVLLLQLVCEEYARRRTVPPHIDAARRELRIGQDALRRWKTWLIHERTGP